MKRTLLYVDDERANLVVFRARFAKHFDLLEAMSAADALELMQRHEVAVLVADQRMPDMTGVELCEVVRREYPHTSRMILTGYTDSDAMMEAINKGKVYAFVTKPWERDTLLPVLLGALQSYNLAVSNHALTERLNHAERCAALGQSAAGMAHEMRNQLFMLPLIELIDERYSDQEELVELAQIARQTHDRLSALIDEITRFVRREPDDDVRIQVNLADLAREAVSLAAMHESIPRRSLRLDVRAEPEVCCHRAKIQQVIFNLIKNAADALTGREHGEIRVIVDEEPGGAILKVADNGPGIDVDLLERIWEPFFTTKGAGGTGLGLDLCRTIITAHGGSIACEGRPGEGAEFTLRLSALQVIQAS